MARLAKSTTAPLVGAPVAGPTGTRCFTSRYTLDADAVVATARWSGIPVGPFTQKAMGRGYWAGIGDDHNIYVLRFSDGRRWVFPAPKEGEGINDDVVSLRYIDEDVVFFGTLSNQYRVHLAALGEGMPAE